MSNEQKNHHVLAWYRLARDLNKNNISAICVFDGKERNIAKANETKRRLEVRQLTLARGSIEDARFQRLHDLKVGMDQFQSLDDTGRKEILQLLKQSAFQTVDGSETLLGGTSPAKEAIRPPATEAPVIEPPETIEPHAPSLDGLITQPTPLTTTEYLASLLNNLHISYKANIANLVSVSTDTQQMQQTLPGEERSDKTMSKHQYELNVQEGKIWEEICGGVDKLTLEISEVAEKEVDTLLEKSQVMANSFQKRNNAPTAQTYRDSKEILQAMGIPCIDATGAIEAEALASSMVLKGLADYVVSEDTDVLVYEAPLIRNITSIVEPLLIISGADIRKELDLDRAAYVDLVLLLGTDFSQRIKNLGPVRAYDFIKKYGTIEKILDAIENQPKYELKLPRDAYLAQVQIARLVFGTLPPLPSAELMRHVRKDDTRVAAILRHYGLQQYMMEDLGYKNILAESYFHDNPQAA
ncbi:PIN domain-like protein [Pholiota conissans]|uniref:Exonuclease 1 n=1 Tax=Pholiota conissans TaxID=109636 RepID=A0A9P6D6L7_9AGAR|nr:PIN domain-like protein [Pholiota conissans]